MKSLVIVESPSKAKTINKYLGKEFIVKASKGHVVDLPKSKIGIDPENNFKAAYEVTNKKSLKELKDAYKDADKLVLAVDLDREGEAIAWHVAQKLGAITESGNAKKGHNVERIVFSEITKDAIRDAIEHPRELDMNLVNAQQARRFLDRLVGYKLSPILWKKIMFGLSAGRVQSVALRLVVEREEERNAFKPDEYWSVVLYASDKAAKGIEVKILKKDLDKSKSKDEEESSEKKKEDERLEQFVKFELAKVSGKTAKVTSEADAKNITKLLESAKEITIEDIKTKTVKRNPKPPFITSTLQQSAVNKYGMTAKRVMMAAQKLYENGFITYMRTDSVTMSKQAVEGARRLVKKEYGERYLPAKSNAYKSSNKAAQEAHECIRPVDFTVETDKKFTPEQAKIYTLIRNRALASQMTPAEIEQVSVTTIVEDHEFRAKGSRILFDGFMRAMKQKFEEQLLPDFSKGDSLAIHEVHGNQHFTQPPARYSEASLIKKLEELGIGRPSTYSSIISTILSRKYAEKEGRYLFPTDTGNVVNRLLTKYFTDVVDYAFTSGMEENLDQVAIGKMDWHKMLKDFYDPFEKQIEKKTEEIPRDEFTVLGEAPDDIKCPECGSKMIIKLGRYGRFYSCSRFPDCKGMRSIDGQSEEDLEKEATSDEFLAEYEPGPKTDDGRDYVLKKGRYGKFWAHPDYPKVKDARPLKLRPEKIKEKYGDAPKTDDGRDYLLRSGRFGEFWAHPDYPKIKDIKKVMRNE